MKCSYCGQMLRDDAQFCSNCGRIVESTVIEPIGKKKDEKGAYALSIMTLLIVLALLAYGCYVIISRNLPVNNSVSASDKATDSLNYESVVIDPALVGKWVCTDKTLADYDDTNIGVEVKAMLTMTADGKCRLDYAMSDTGVPALTISAEGVYTTDKGVVTFIPDETDGLQKYLRKHGKKPAFPYAADDDCFTLTYENGREIVFIRAKE